jgi:hypothetical protein
MSDNSKKVSELPQASNVASTDRVMVLRDPSGVPSARTITVNNFVRSLTVPGPYDTDTAANTAGIAIGHLYYDSAGTVKIRIV